MMKHLQEAFSFDIHIRRDVDTFVTSAGLIDSATIPVVNPRGYSRTRVFRVPPGPAWRYPVAAH